MTQIRVNILLFNLLKRVLNNLHHFFIGLLIFLISLFGLMRVLATFIHDFVVDGDQTCTTFAVAKQSTPPVDAVATVRVATVDVTIVEELKVLLPTLLVARCTKLKLAFELLDFFLRVEPVMMLLRVGYEIY